MAGKVKWHGKKLRLKLKGAKAAMVDAAAFAIEREAKAGAAVDTGFMVNSGYVVTPKSNTYGEAAGKAMSKKRHPSQLLAPPAEPPPEGAILGFAARYTLYVETTQPFIYPAVERVAAMGEAEIVAAGRREL